MQLRPNTLLQGGKYRIVRILGQGGFGITYEAEQVLLFHKVAIKEFFMKDCCERDETTNRVTVGTGNQRVLVEKFRGKFFREAQMIAGMEHRNIVRVTDVFEENGTAYYVMDYLPGGSLAAKVKKDGPLSEVAAEKYIRQVADALAYVHSQDTVHLDVKPSNILLNAEGEAVLIDFGISKHYDKAGEQTSSTPVGISKGYSPLEQSRDGNVSQFGPSTDIYALGATLFFLLSGQVPDEASIVHEYGLRRQSVISDRMWRVVEASMRPLRGDRPQTIKEFLSILKEPSKIVGDAADDTIVRKEHDDTFHDSEHEGSGTVSRPKTWLWAVLIVLSALMFILTLFLGLKGCNRSSGIDVRQPTEEPVRLEVLTRGTVNGHDWVDLGVSVKWATTNVGASTPEAYGSYFAWGETSPKSEYKWENYQFHVTGDSWENVTFSKYSTKSARGAVDNKTRLDYGDDAARVNWEGSWRMPTRAEFDELLTKCTWTWTTQGGKNGYKVTSKTNGNSIFLPASGYRFGGSLYYGDSAGYYWSSSLLSGNPFGAHSPSFSADKVEWYRGARRSGFPVRPVTE